ncbi:response regulator [Niabella ginsengisoli]|uniref:Response regulator n=1 Tax=Niabella ginsengisoli TaxID=522298 RepID=A0ABS9SLM6_9BACT|nr:response regulator [Niabella ginsengisoli]MCH5599287.1 response regulator [Niabella ginsengisoli]
MSAIKLNCIVLIDDNRAANFINKIILDKIDCAEHVIAFDSGEEAFKYLTNKDVESYIKPDLIFLDINMPKMDGWEFVAKLSDDSKTLSLHIPIIILTTSSNPTDLEKAHNTPEVKELINKPLKKETVLKILEKYFPA